MTAFLHYIKAKCDSFKQENKNLKHKEVIAKLGGIWKSLSDKEKEPFEALAKIDKDRYARDKAEYEAANKTVAPKK